MENLLTEMGISWNFIYNLQNTWRFSRIFHCVWLPEGIPTAITACAPMRLKTRAASGTIPSAQHSLNSGGLSFDFGVDQFVRHPNNLWGSFMRHPPNNLWMKPPTQRWNRRFWSTNPISLYQWIVSGLNGAALRMFEGEIYDCWGPSAWVCVWTNIDQHKYT